VAAATMAVAAALEALAAAAAALEAVAAAAAALEAAAEAAAVPNSTCLLSHCACAAPGSQCRSGYRR